MRLRLPGFRVKLPGFELDLRSGPEVRVLLNKNVKMSRGKAVAQGIHAALRAFDVPHGRVVVLMAKPDEVARMEHVIHDAGRTEVEPGTMTAGASLVAPDAAEVAVGDVAAALHFVAHIYGDFYNGCGPHVVDPDDWAGTWRQAAEALQQDPAGALVNCCPVCQQRECSSGCPMDRIRERYVGRAGVESGPTTAGATLGRS
jgi:PTH2 family peptidyl-tRNA hydrolase